MTEDRRGGGGVTRDRRGGGEHDWRAGAWWCDEEARRHVRINSLPVGGGTAPADKCMVARRGGGEESGTSGGDEEVGSAAAKRAVRPDEAREDKL